MKTANYFVNPPPINAVHFEEIIRFAAEAMRVADRKTLLVIGQVDNVALIQARTGFNLAGYTRALDNYGVCHTMKQHGDPARELKRGQLAVTLEDFGLIPLITGEPVNVYKDGKKKNWPRCDRVCEADLRHRLSARRGDARQTQVGRHRFDA